MTNSPLVELARATKHYVDNRSFIARVMGAARTVHAVTDVSLRIERGETLGLVGESGCGKSTLGRCLIALEPFTAGDMLFDGTAVDARRSSDLQWFRAQSQIVFQDPQSSLNRSMTVAQTVGRAIRATGRFRTRRARDARVAELLHLVGLGTGFAQRYPHELSGGQRQRVGIARALAVDPKFVVLDEPVSALDVSIQAQIINLLLDLQRELDLTYLFISHDLGLIRYFADRIAVMYLGRIVEIGPAATVYENPRHPYTRLLLSAAPKPDPTADDEIVEDTGEVPSPINPPTGCAFHPRCPFAFDRCRTEVPQLKAPNSSDADGGVEAACHLFDPDSAVAIVDSETREPSMQREHHK